MRHLLLAVAAGTLVLGACSDQTPTEPTVPPPSENFGSSCRVTPFPLLAIANQIKAIYPATPRAQALLRAEALLRAGAIKLLWDTCHPALARKVAFASIDWLTRHTPPGKEAQVQDLIIAILRGIEGATGTQSVGDFGVGVFDPNTPGNTLITTVNGRAAVLLPHGSFLERTVITISRKADNFQLSNFSGRQFPPKYDYTATNASNQHVLADELTASVGFCLVELESDGIPGVYPAGGYPENRRMGHNPEPGTPGAPFEVLDPADVDPAADLGLTDEVCGRTPPPIPLRIGLIGSFGAGPSAFATAAFRTAARYLGPIFMPQPLWATALIPLPPPPPLTGKPRGLSPFGVVEASRLLIAAGGNPEDRTYESGVPIGWNCEGTFCSNHPTVRLVNPAGAGVGGVTVTATLLRVGEGGTTVEPFAAGSTTSVVTDTGEGVGYATFDNLIVDGAGQFKIRFSAPGVASVTTGDFGVTAL